MIKFFPNHNSCGLSVKKLIQNDIKDANIKTYWEKPANHEGFLKHCFGLANALYEDSSSDRNTIVIALNRLESLVNQVGCHNKVSNNDKATTTPTSDALYHLVTGVISFRTAMIQRDEQPLQFERYYDAQQHFDHVKQANGISYWLAQLFHAKCSREMEKEQYHYQCSTEYKPLTPESPNSGFAKFKNVYSNVPILDDTGKHIALDALINMGRWLQNQHLFRQAKTYYDAALWVFREDKAPPISKSPFTDKNTLMNRLKELRNTINVEGDNQQTFRDQILQARINQLICYIEGYRDYATAQTLHDKITDDDKDNIDAKNNLARVYYKQQRYDEAISKLDEVISSMPPLENGLSRNHRFAMLEQVKCYIKLHQFRKANELLSLLQSVYPMDYEIRLWQAIWHRNQKQLQPAIDLLQEICNANLPIRRGTIALRANFVAGTCYLEWNRPEQAYKYFKAIQDAVGDDVSAAKNLGWCQQLVGEYKQAIETYKNTLSIIESAKQATKEADCCDTASIHISPRQIYNLVSTHNNLGQCYIYISDYSQALKQFCATLDEEPFNSRALCLAAHCLRKLEAILKLKAKGDGVTLSSTNLQTIQSVWEQNYPDSKAKPQCLSQSQKCTFSCSDLLMLAIDFAQLARKYANFDCHTSSEYVLCLLAAWKVNKTDSTISEQIHNCLSADISYPHTYCLEALVQLSDFVQDEINSSHLTKLYAHYAYLRPPQWESCYEQVLALTTSPEYRKLSDDKKGKLLMYIYQLHHTMDKIKNELRITKADSNAINRYRHYTSLRSLKALLATNSAEPPRFRLSNVASMNDSAEGDPLIQLLHQRKENKDEQALCKPNQNKQEEKTDFHTVLQRFGLHAGCPSGLSGLRNVYITSLCSATDYIYMWAIYADKGAGCNLLFGEHFFDIKQSPTPGFVPYFEEASSYPLYRIEYVTENDDGTVTLQTGSASGSQSASLSELIDALSDKLYDIDNLLNDDPSDTDMSIRHRITNMLDQVRYLFKYDEYASEQEVRCIVVTASHKLDESKEGIPYLYTEIEKDIEFDEVCLGPKAVQIPETEAWLYATGRVKQVTHSKRHYR